MDGLGLTHDLKTLLIHRHLKKHAVDQHYKKHT